MTTLLPSGLADVLPPHAAQEFRLVHHFLKSFMAFDYAPVIPPLAEFSREPSPEALHVADPLSGRILSLRSDMTGQVARIAAQSLSAAERPLRLCYAGYTLRASSGELMPRRQHTQTGIERFGPVTAAAISEVLVIACHTLAGAGIAPLVVDINYPSLLPALLQAFPAALHTSLREAVAHKDTGTLKRLGAGDLAAVLNVAGDASPALTQLRALNIPALADPLREVEALLAALRAQQCDAAVTIDLLDLRGEGRYHRAGYSLYWQSQGIEVGRGGVYRSDAGEEAVGFTLYLNELLERLPAEALPQIRDIPAETSAAEAAKLHALGIVTRYR